MGFSWHKLYPYTLHIHKPSQAELWRCQRCYLMAFQQTTPRLHPPFMGVGPTGPTLYLAGFCHAKDRFDMPPPKKKKHVIQNPCHPNKKCLCDFPGWTKHCWYPKWLIKEISQPFLSTLKKKWHSVSPPIQGKIGQTKLSFTHLTSHPGNSNSSPAPNKNGVDHKNQL